MRVKGNNPIFLIGFMAAGKTTIERQLAKALNCAFIDLDEMIEINSGATINEIFALRGEEYFRKFESILLKALECDSK